MTDQERAAEVLAEAMGKIPLDAINAAEVIQNLPEDRREAVVAALNGIPLPDIRHGLVQENINVTNKALALAAQVAALREALQRVQRGLLDDNSEWHANDDRRLEDVLADTAVAAAAYERRLRDPAVMPIRDYFDAAPPHFVPPAGNAERWYVEGWDRARRDVLALLAGQRGSGDE